MNNAFFCAFLEVFVDYLIRGDDRDDVKRLRVDKIEVVIPKKKNLGFLRPIQQLMNDAGCFENISSGTVLILIVMTPGPLQRTSTSALAERVLWQASNIARLHAKLERQRTRV